LERASKRLEEMFGLDVNPLEDHVAKAVRSSVPPLMERISSLPDRLRLLGLKGEDRAAALSRSCGDLLQNDASGAPAILGGITCSIPEDEKWARGILKVLVDDGEDEVRLARHVLQGLQELRRDFPALGTSIPATAVATAKEVLESEAFYQRMTDLRAARRQVETWIQGRYKEERERFIRESEEVRSRLEANQNWTVLTDEQRDALRGQLGAADLPGSQVDWLAGLRTALTRVLGLPALERDLGKKRDELAALTVRPTGSVEGGAGAPKTETVTYASVFPSRLISSASDVESVVQDARGRLLERVQQGPFRLGEP
jgi:hypothetical protein